MSKCVVRVRGLGCWMGLGCLLASMVVARADESQQPAREVRMWHVGNSWSVPFPFEGVGLPRAFVHGTHNLGGRPIEDMLTNGWIGEALNRDRRQNNVLEKGDFDVVYLGFVQLLRPVEGLDLLFDIVQKHKPGAPIYLQHAWALPFHAKHTHDEDDLAQLDAAWGKYRSELEAVVDAANKRFGKRVVFIVPLHDAVMKLRRMVAAGKFPRVATQEELFWGAAGARDDHGNNQIYALGPLCAYAAIHGRTPEGMRPTFPADGKFTGPHSKVPVDDEQIDVLAKIAWETVSTYPYAGVANKDGPDR